MGTRVKTLLWIQALVASIAWLTVSAVACGDDGAESAPDTGAAAVEAEAPPEEPPEPPPRDLGPPRRVFAKRFVANVRNAPTAEGQRIGYLRAGATLMSKTSEPVGTDGCPGGWFELGTGGFVCNRRDVIVFDGERLPEVRAAQPDRDADLPYQYGYARGDNVAVYRGLPTDDEAAEFEGYRIPGREPPPAPEGEAPGAAAGEQAAEAAHSEAATPAGIGGAEAGAEATPPPSAGMAAVMGMGDGMGAGMTMGSDMAAGAEGEATASAEEEGGEDEEEVDAGPPTLRSLRGNRHSILMRRMMKGFYVSLDREFRANRRRYWRTQQHEFIPHRALNLKRGGEFEGFNLRALAGLEPEPEPDGNGAALPAPLRSAGRLRTPPARSRLGPPTRRLLVEGNGNGNATEEETAAAHSLPVGWVLSSRTHSYTVREDGRARRNRRDPGYHHSFHIIGEHEFRGEVYWLGDDGHAYRARDITRAESRPRPDDVGADEKWIDVDLTTQTLVAYEGDTPVYATLVSTGVIIQEGVPGQDHRSPPGRYRIRAKHLATTMDGDNAFDGPYSIQDVPYVMYYEQGYALHTAFWHSLFGRTKSHGCVNLSPRDARWMFNWSDPQLPEGWHGVYPETPEDGTLIIVHGETPFRRR